MKQEDVDGLKSLIEDRKSFILPGENSIFQYDVEVLENAITLILEKEA